MVSGDGTQSKYLFGDDLSKRLKEAKEASNVGLAVNTSHTRNNNYRARKGNDKRNWRQTNGDKITMMAFHALKKGVKQQQQPYKK